MKLDDLVSLYLCFIIEESLNVMLNASVNSHIFIGYMISTDSDFHMFYNSFLHIMLNVSVQSCLSILRRQFGYMREEWKNIISIKVMLFIIL